MNKILLLSIIGALMLTSCGDDDDNSVNTIIGSWVATNFSVTSCDDPTVNNEVDSFSSEPCTASSMDECVHITYTFTGDILTIETSQFLFGTAESATDSGTFTTDGDQLTECYDGECFTSTFNID
ncbi:hypothetical protein N9L92_04295, partial [Saprospiraceae bacterium]|nr:hypothetical protein [Saprospiraceae bacterium]